MLPPPPLVSMEDDACYMNADSSPTTYAHTVCRALNACALFEQPLPAGCAGDKGGNNDGGTSGGGRYWIVRRIGMVLPSPPERQRNSNEGGRQVKTEATKRAIATATRVASNGNGDGDGGKSDGDGNNSGGQVTTRAMVAAMTVAGNNEGYGKGNEQATKRVRAARRWQQ
jgi:hypothetical protein